MSSPPAPRPTRKWLRTPKQSPGASSTPRAAASSQKGRLDDPLGVLGEERFHGPEVGAGDSLRPLQDPVAVAHADHSECLAEG